MAKSSEQTTQIQSSIFIPVRLTVDPDTGEGTIELNIEGGLLSPVDARAYISIEEAAKRLGISYNLMSEWVHRADDPVPTISSGRKRLVRAKGLEEYARRREGDA